MPNYKKLYYFLFNQIGDIIELLELAQQQAEERLLSEKEPPIEIRKTPPESTQSIDILTDK